MRTNLTITLALLSSLTLRAQPDSTALNDRLLKSPSALHDLRFTAKTDLLAIMNTVIEPAQTDITIGCEMSFSKMNGVQLNLHMRTSHEQDDHDREYRIDARYIYYIEDYEYAGLNIGGICSLLKSKSIPDYKNSYVKFDELILQFGISGGYRLMFTQHWLISPEACVVVSRVIYGNTLWSGFAGPNYSEGLFERVTLEIGYRF
jgi:hypothetical protein